MTKASIVIPVYNAELFIEDCLRSVTSQTMTDGVECILVDDCGTDDSMQLAKQFIDNNKSNVCFKILHQEHNQGPSAARNRGIREATGEYLFFLDSDDKISSDCIENLYSLAHHYDADYVQGTYESNEGYHMPRYGEEMPRFTDDCRFIKRTLLNYMVIPFTPHNRLVRRQLILDHDLFFTQKIYVREDFHWMFFLAKHVHRMAVCKKETYYRGYNENSLTHDINIEREILAYRTLIEDFTQNIDSFLSGEQKNLILDTLLMALRSKYYHDEAEKKYLVGTVQNSNSQLERLLLNLYFKFDGTSIQTKILHLLVKIYKLAD